MKYIFLIVVLFAGSVYGAECYRTPYYPGTQFRVVPRLNVIAVHPFRNPYFTPNPNFEPAPFGVGEVVDNPYLNEPKASAPRGLLDILVEGTYKVKK